MTLNDAILEATGGPTVNDGLLAFFIAGGATGPTLPDAERQWLCLKLGVPTSIDATNQDLWMQHLASYPGALNDKLFQFWSTPQSLTAQVQALFAKYSAAGGMWDFTDMATLFQDSARTVPVTAASQPVGGVNDISGLHSVLAQPTNAARPQFNGAGVTPDGVDDFFVTAANLNLSACDKVVVAMGYTKVDDTTRMQAELSTDGTNPGMFYFVSGVDSTYQNYYFGGQGTPALAAAAGFATPRPNEYGAHIGRGSIPGNLGQVWWNGTRGTDSTRDRVGGTMGDRSLYLLSRGGFGLFSNTPARRALVMGVPVAGTQVSDDDIELIRLWLMEGA